MNATMHKARGWTLIELLVVMAILGVLAAAVMPLSESWVLAQKERELKQALWDIRDAIDRYKAMSDRGDVPIPPGANGYPADLLSLVKGVPSKNTGETQMYFLRRLPRDPFADPKLAPEETWGLRSYASSPSEPQAGVDVYDVYSRSTLKAMDGSAYNAW